MGCVSSKFARKDPKPKFAFGKTHVVSLTSSTYGVLDLTQKLKCIIEVKKSSPPWEDPEPAEVINAWELMADLDETELPCFTSSKKSPKSRVCLDTRRSPSKFSNQKGESPKKLKRFRGKENNGGRANVKTEPSPKTVLKNERISPNTLKLNSSMADSGISGPLFDPELIAYFEKELSEEAIHKSDENAVVIYTTTLRGIRKTFEDCNTVRSILRSHQVRTFERDVSMDFGFKKELRGRMPGTTAVKLPVVFVEGRLIGGIDEIVKLEEEGKLGTLLAGIPRAAAGGGCIGCGGVQFMLCFECSGSCKVVGEDGKSKVKCGECNENGLIQCPICC